MLFGYRTGRIAAAAACASAGLLLAGCGSSTVESRLTPDRIIVFGDGFADVGQNGTRYTINGDGTVATWVEQVAARYGRTVTAASAGGTGYARGNARVSTKPDAAGSSSTLTVAEQIDAYIAAGGTFTANDMVFFGAGTSDLIVEGKAVIDGTQSADQAATNLTTAAQALSTQVRRVIAAGATHVVVAGAYNLGRSPWAIQTSQTSMLETLSSRFNDQFKVASVDLGSVLLYVDTASYINNLTGFASSYGMSNVTVPICTSVDAGAGIGTGTGQVNSANCTTSTLDGAYTSTTSAFADRIYLTPQAGRLLGDNFYGRITLRF